MNERLNFLLIGPSGRAPQLFRWQAKPPVLSFRGTVCQHRPWTYTLTPPVGRVFTFPVMAWTVNQGVCMQLSPGQPRAALQLGWRAQLHWEHVSIFEESSQLGMGCIAWDYRGNWLDPAFLLPPCAWSMPGAFHSDWRHHCQRLGLTPGFSQEFQDTESLIWYSSPSVQVDPIGGHLLLVEKTHHLMLLEKSDHELHFGLLTQAERRPEDSHTDMSQGP